MRAANGLFHALEPWNMKKEGRLEELSSATAVAMETSRIVGLLLQPVVPQFASQLLGEFRCFFVFCFFFL